MRKGGGYHSAGKKHPKRGDATQQFRIRTPREGEVIGLVLSLLGGTHLLVDCKDGKERICRIPGRLRKRIWVREGDIVIVKPWEIEGHKKGDIIWRYNQINLSWLRNNGYL